MQGNRADAGALAGLTLCKADRADADAEPLAVPSRHIRKRLHRPAKRYER